MQSNLVRSIALGLFTGLCASLGVSADPPKVAAPEAVPQSTATAASEPATWKIPSRPQEEMKQLAPLEEVTNFFRATYAAERARVQRSQGVVILFRFSGATLFRGGEIVETVRVIPSEYHNLRYAAHVPFALFLKLHPLSGLPFDETTQSEISDCIGLLRRAEQALDRTELNKRQLLRQHRIFANAIAFLGQTLNAGTIEDDSLRQYARAASVDVEQNMREAGAAQVNGIHQQLLKWRKQIPTSEWENTHFIVHGPQQPRGGHAATQYLSALLKDPGDGRGYVGESRRVVYKEDTSIPATSTLSSPWEADLELLAAIDLDATASQALFSDPDRLAVDIAADGARQRIRELDFSPLQPIAE